MTPAQKRMLSTLASCSLFVPHEQNFKSKTQMLERLVEQGFASVYVHGGYQITDAGRKALAEALKLQRPGRNHKTTCNWHWHITSAACTCVGIA